MVATMVLVVVNVAGGSSNLWVFNGSSLWIFFFFWWLGVEVVGGGGGSGCGCGRWWQLVLEVAVGLLVVEEMRLRIKNNKILMK